jgi:ABC-type Co2+ transport system permease subunit
VLLALLGLLAIAVGVVYFVVEAKDLPSVLGKLSHFTGHRTKRGIAAVVVGAVLLAAAVALPRLRPPRTD